jgi:hypothetical protein
MPGGNGLRIRLTTKGRSSHKRVVLRACSISRQMERDRGGSGARTAHRAAVEGGGEDGHRAVPRGPLPALDLLDAFSIRDRLLAAPIALG